MKTIFFTSILTLCSAISYAQEVAPTCQDLNDAYLQTRLDPHGDLEDQLQELSEVIENNHAAFREMLSFSPLRERMFGYVSELSIKREELKSEGKHISLERDSDYRSFVSDTASVFSAGIRLALKGVVASRLGKDYPVISFNQENGFKRDLVVFLTKPHEGISSMSVKLEAYGLSASVKSVYGNSAGKMSPVDVHYSLSQDGSWTKVLYGKSETDLENVILPTIDAGEYWSDTELAHVLLSQRGYSSAQVDLLLDQEKEIRRHCAQEGFQYEGEGFLHGLANTEGRHLIHLKPFNGYQDAGEIPLK